MKKKLLVPLFLLLFYTGYSQVGIGTTDPKGALDIRSGNEGLLIPRVALLSTTELSPINDATATESELVYNTATVSDVTPGYYYLSTATGPWVRLGSGSGGGGTTNPAWELTGNAGTNPGTNFLGTTDNRDMAIRTFDTEKIRVTAMGNVGIGTTVPAGKLDIAFDPLSGANPNKDRILVSQNADNKVALQTYIDGQPATYAADSDYTLSLQHLKGRVGIGTTAPSAKLSVFAGTIGTAVNTEMDLANFGGLSGSSTRLGVSLFKTGATNNWNNTALLLGYDVDVTKRAGGFISMLNGNVGVGTATPRGKLDIMAGNSDGIYFERAVDNQFSIQTYIDGQPLSYVNDVNYPLSLQPTKGYVGIGTTAPASKLHVQGSGGASEIAIFGSATDNRYVTFGNGASNTGGYIQSQTAAGLFNLGHHGFANQLVLKNDGNVGIGIAAPTDKLHVVGNVRASQYLVGQYVNTSQGEELLSSYPSSTKSFPIRTNSDNFIRMFSAADMRSALGITMPTGDNLGNHTATTTLNLVGQAVTSNAGTVIDGGGGWHRTYGQTGWFNGTYGGGMYMIDTDWVRTYGSKNLYCNTLIRADGGLASGNLAPGAGNIGATGQITAASAVNSGEWFRNTVAGLGLYNNALGNHFAAVTDADWRISGNAGSCGLGFASSSDFTTLYGYAYGDAAGIGFLSPGRGWAIRWLNNITYITGSVEITGTMNSTGYRETSDRRWKKDIAPIANPLAKIMALKGVGYSFKTKQELSSQSLDSTYNFTATPQIGFIAQDVESVLPEVVGTDSKGYKTVEYAKVVAVLTEAMKEQQKQIEEQQKQIEALKSQNIVLKASGDKVDALEARLGQLEQLLGKANGIRASTEQ